jgi:hypothetical protein
LGAEVKRTEPETDDVDRAFSEARAEIDLCRRRADVMLFLADEVEGRIIIRQMQARAAVLNTIAQHTPTRRREAEMLMGECARVWTGIATHRPWAWR